MGDGDAAGGDGGGGTTRCDVNVVHSSMKSRVVGVGRTLEELVEKMY